jgi:dipeptidase
MKKVLSVLLFSVLVWPALACTSYLVTPGASADGSSMISYAADSHIRYGELYYWEGGQQKPGAYFQTYYRGSHKPLAKVPQPEFTYTVVGYLNEKQVAIGESTFGGRPELFDTTGMIDYSSLMFLALQWSPTARDAIRVFSELVDEYGYYSSGQSFSIADPYEVWMVEMIGKGTDMQYDRRRREHYNANKGAVWVAKRIPDGYISAHANHARITTFPMADGKVSITNKQFDMLHDPDIRVVYSHDVISFARQQGYYDGRDEDFSFSDVYAPLSFTRARFCEARVWSLFRKVNDEMDQFESYAMGYELDERMPLYIRPERKLSVEDLMSFKRDYLQGTEYDKGADLGAGPWGSPYRWGALTWEIDGQEYFHERPTATQQTGFVWISQSRRGFPDHIGGRIWFGVDDANLTVYVPMYAGIRRAPDSYAVGNGHILEYSETSAFWTFNKVSNFVYSRYNLMLPDVRRAQDELEGKFLKYVPGIDQAALALYETDPELARDFLTDFSVTMGNYTQQRWEELFRFLLVKFMDGNVKKSDGWEFLTNEYGKYPIVQRPGYPEWWLRLVIETHGDKFLIPEQD